jgi:hypothetical protein
MGNTAQRNVKIAKEVVVRIFCAVGTRTLSVVLSHGVSQNSEMVRAAGFEPAVRELLQQCLGVFAGGVGLAAEHAGQFSHPRFFVEQLDFRDGPSVPGLLGDDVMGFR